MALGWGGAALSPTIWVAVPLVVVGAAGNGAAIISNQLLSSAAPRIAIAAGRSRRS